MEHKESAWGISSHYYERVCRWLEESDENAAFINVANGRQLQLNEELRKYATDDISHFDNNNDDV